MTTEKIIELIQKECNNPAAARLHAAAGPQPGMLVPKESLLEVARVLHTHPDCYFDLLSCISGIDNGLEADTMEVIYHLYSIPYNIKAIIYVLLPRSVNEQHAPEDFYEMEGILLPKIPSVESIWRTADWHEREAFDLLGIYFENHPDLRRILLPADWKGFPLRKDYKEQEEYHGIKVAY